MLFFFTLGVPWEKTAKAALHSDLQRLHPIQIVTTLGWRQRLWLGSGSQRCPLRRGCVRRTSRHSLAPRQRQTAAGVATADQDLKTCPGNITVGHAARPFAEGFEDKVHFHMCYKGFRLKRIPFCKIMQPFLV